MSAIAVDLTRGLAGIPGINRGREFLLCGQPDGRSEPRHFITLPAVIQPHSEDSRKHVALIRDVSEHGIFFYSDIKPAKGTLIGFAFTVSKPATVPISVSGTGEVVRVVEPAQGAAIGVALKVHDYAALSPS